jgi:hypothetical protein
MSNKSRQHGYNHPPANPKENSAQKETTNRHVYIEPGVQIDIVQDLKNQHKTERDEDKASHKSQIFWTKVTAVLVLIYTLIMGYQLKVAKETFNVRIPTKSIIVSEFMSITRSEVMPIRIGAKRR